MKRHVASILYNKINIKVIYVRNSLKIHASVANTNYKDQNDYSKYLGSFGEIFIFVKSVIE